MWIKMIIQKCLYYLKTICPISEQPKLGLQFRSNLSTILRTSRDCSSGGFGKKLSSKKSLRTFAVDKYFTCSNNLILKCMKNFNHREGPQINRNYKYLVGLILYILYYICYLWCIIVFRNLDQSLMFPCYRKMVEESHFFILYLLYLHKLDYLTW